MVAISGLKLLLISVKLVIINKTELIHNLVLNEHADLACVTETLLG